MKRILKPGTIILLIILQFFRSSAQDKTVVIMGSSTAEGVDATSYANSWAGKIEAYYNRNNAPGNPDTNIINIAVSGRTTWHEMPDGYINPLNRPAVNEGCFDPPYSGCNVTRALSYNPDIVIINLPTNDVGNLYAGYNPKETMDNFRYLFSYITGRGIKCFIATTQPRNDLSAANRQILRNLVDSININFGVFAIDFWTDLVVASNMLKDEVRSGTSPYHLNNTGHNFLFERVRSQNIFTVSAPLPVFLKDFRAQPHNNQVMITWATADEEDHTSFEIQRGATGIDFGTLVMQKAQGSKENEYSWIDPSPLAGKSFYRLKITEPAKTTYSKVVSIIHKEKPFSLAGVHANGSLLHIKINSAANQQILLTVIDNRGVFVKRKTYDLGIMSSSLSIAIPGLAAGAYYLQIDDLKGNTDLRRFIKR